MKVFYFKDNENEAKAMKVQVVSKYDAVLLKKMKEKKSIVVKDGKCSYGGFRWTEIKESEFKKIQDKMKSDFSPSQEYLNAALKKTPAAKLKKIYEDIEGLEYENADIARVELATGAYNETVMKHL